MHKYFYQKFNYFSFYFKNKGYFIFTLLVLLCGGLNQKLNAQQLYPKAPEQGILGTMYNPFPYGIYSVETLHHGTQNVIASVYLPFYDVEKYNFPGVIPLPLVSPYTSAVALCAEKGIGVYAPVEVGAAIGNPLFPGLIDAYHPFAAMVNAPGQNVPFNQLIDLNTYDPTFQHPFDSKVAVSILEATQKFNEFTHALFSWNGFDKAGTQVITNVVNDIPHLTGFYPPTKQIFFSTQEPIPFVSRDVVGHEISHGILWYNFSLHNPNTQQEYSEQASAFPRPVDALIESFCDIMGLASFNWHDNKFQNPSWTYDNFSGDPDNMRPFDKPKANSLPNTYFGTYWTPIGMPGYDKHINGSVMNHWFYILVEGEWGSIDNDIFKDKYFVYPINKNKAVGYFEALNIVFNTCTQLLDDQTTYAGMRAKTLEATVQLGYPIGSFEYIQVMNAWHAVGVGPKWVQNQYNPECNLPAFEAESWYNSLIKFTGMKATVTPDVLSLKEAYLEDCTQNIKTLDFAELEPDQVTPFVDVNEDQIYGFDNDLDKSKKAVSIQAFSEVSQAWFNFKFNHKGPDGKGQVPVINVLGNPTYTYPTFDINSHKFYYPNAPESASRDEISTAYFRSINYFLKNDPNLVNDYNYLEWEAIRNGLAQIFALNIKNDYKALLPVPEPEVWTLNEDILNTDFKVHFDNPNLSNQPKLYHGLNWNDIYPAKNSGILNFWHYLLVHGTDNAQGYTNEKGHTYFIIPLDKYLALKVLWDTYKTVPMNANFEEFRLASLQALHTLGYSDKSKEHIALYDAWAAVMDMPDYASNLKHEPADGETIYPWAAKLGVEVEYPLLESSRVFQVSESATFNVQAAPVYSFFNYTAPDMNTGMTYGRVNLLPGKTYFARSHLYQSGSAKIGVAGGCDVSEDPVLCMSLEGKEKWTPTYSFNTTAIDMINDGMSPAAGSMAPAWDTPFSWGSILGAQGYLMKIGDDAGVVPMGSVAGTLMISAPYDEDVAVVYHNLILSQDKNYTYTLAARTKLGSDEGVKGTLDPVLNYTKYIPLTPEEKAALPDAFSASSDPITFKTDIPKIVLGDPAEGTEVSMIGKLNLKASPNDPRADFFRGRIYYKQDGEQPNDYQDVDVPEMSVNIQDLPFLKDGHTFGWSFAAKKNAVDPFIPTEESGALAPPKHFVVKKELIPQPKLVEIDCVPDGFAQLLKWHSVPGAKGYQYAVKNLANNQLVVNPTITEQLQSPPIVGASTFPNKYEWSVSAGIQDADGAWVFGLPATSVYHTAPKYPTALSPGNQDVALEPNHSITLKWSNVQGVNKVLLSLYKLVPNGLDEVFKDKLVQGSSLVVGNQEAGESYQWTVRSLSDEGCTSGGLSRTYHIIQTEDKPSSDQPSGGGSGGDPKPGACPGYFQVSITNADLLQLSILHNVLGGAVIEEGSQDLNDGTYQAFIWDGGFFYPTGYTANDEIVLHIKVKSLFADWASISFNQIPEVTIITSGGKIMTHKFTLFDWSVDQEIWMGSYKCSEN
ncbi:MAG: M4 family metallopeptidase [Sphingobacteriaceae bacterium]